MQAAQSTTPNLARLRIDNIKPKWVTCVWLAFFVLIGILFLLTLAIPESVVTVKNQTFFNSDVGYENPYLTKQFNLKNNPTYPYYPIFILNRDPRNQFLLVEITPRFQDGASVQAVIPINYTFTAYEVAKLTYRQGDAVYPTATHAINVNCNTGSKICENRTVVYINEIDSQNYMILLQFNNLDDLSSRSVLTFDAYITFINTNYTDFLLALRYLCLGLTLIFLVFYWLSLRKMRGEKVVYEQKFIRILGILLIFFNDPIYAATALKPTLVAAVFSTFFLITFVCALLLFWITAFERIQRENTQIKTRILTWQKGVFIFFLWLFSVVAYIILSREYLTDPSFDFNDEYQEEFKAFKILMIIFIAIGLGWMFFEYVQILRKYNSRIWRHKMLFSFSTYFIFCYFIFMFTGTMSVYNMNGTKVMLLFGITNVYIWFLMVLYSPSGRGLEGADQPISLSDHIREFNNYEPLDESGNIEMGKGPFKHYGSAEPQEEVASPDEIIFQLDNNGNVVGKNQQQEKRNQGQNVNNNFGFDANTFGNHAYGANNHQESSGGNFGGFNEDAWKNQSHEEKKYPFEANEDGEGGDLS